MRGDIKRNSLPTQPEKTGEDQSLHSEPVVDIEVTEELVEEKSFIVPSVFELESMMHIGGKPPAQINSTSKESFDRKKIKEKKIRKDHPNFSLILTAIIFGVLLIIFGLTIFSSISKLKSGANQIAADFSGVKDSLQRGHTEELFQYFNDIKSQSGSLQLRLERLGQDIKLYSYLGGMKSQYAQSEITLSLTNDVLRRADQSANYIKDRSKVWFSQDSYMIDFAIVKDNLLHVTGDWQKDLALDKRLANGLSTPEGLILVEQIDKASDYLSQTHEFLETDLDKITALDQTDRKYLIIFQNNGELRGSSGGSLGSFGIANVSKGKLINIDFAQNIFKTDKAFEAKTHIDPPDEIKYLRQNWVLKDSGWSVDGPMAFATIADFYQKETGKAVDGVITLDISFVEQLMKSVEPIKMPGSGATLTATNIRGELDQEVHTDYFTDDQNKIENEPKRVIGDLMPIMINKTMDCIKNGQKIPSLIQAIDQSLKEKHVLLYFADETIEKRIEKANLAGKLNHTIGDFISVNNSNIGGAKSSQNIDEAISLNVDINKDGNVINTATIERAYNKSGNDNVNFVRFIIPENSKIQKFEPLKGNFQRFASDGLKGGQYFWESTEANKKLINFWLTTRPGETSSASITYTGGNLNVSSDFSYKIMLQRQPGAPVDNYSLTINYPSGFKPTNVQRADTRNRKITLNLTLNQDQTIVINFSKLNK